MITPAKQPVVIAPVKQPEVTAPFATQPNSPSARQPQEPTPKKVWTVGQMSFSKPTTAPAVSKTKDLIEVAAAIIEKAASKEVVQASGESEMSLNINVPS